MSTTEMKAHPVGAHRRFGVGGRNRSSMLSTGYLVKTVVLECEPIDGGQNSSLGLVQPEHRGHETLSRKRKANVEYGDFRQPNKHDECFRTIRLTLTRTISKGCALIR